MPATASVVLNVNAKKASVAVGTEEHLLLGRDHITESLSGVHFQVSANSFFQTNTVQAERLFALVAEACALDGTRDGASTSTPGTGAISLLLARRRRARLRHRAVGGRGGRRRRGTRAPTASTTARS